MTRETITEKPLPGNRLDWQLELFSIRCRELSERVLAGQIPLAEATDMLQSAAEWSGLIDRFGQDEIQSVMARAFIQPKAEAA